MVLGRILTLIPLIIVPRAVAGGPCHVLVTNDDGIDSAGLAAVVEVLSEDPQCRVTVVAPAGQQSGRGSAVVLGDEISVRRHPAIAGAAAWAVDATPATTVQLGLLVILADDPPSLVVSGINLGDNVGRSSWYSGTVGAAREAALAGVPAIACSLEVGVDRPLPDFRGAAAWLDGLVDAVRAVGLPEGVYLNANIPRATDAIRGYRWARMGLEPPQLLRFDEVGAGDGVRRYRSRWRGPVAGAPGSDVRALAEGWVAVVPLGLDHTDYPALAAVQEIEPRPPACQPVLATAAR